MGSEMCIRDRDEVGWYFVEQYYTTMSRNPDKLHLFYSRRSQLVFGTEAESVPVSVGSKVSLSLIPQCECCLTKRPHYHRPSTRSLTR